MRSQGIRKNTLESSGQRMTDPRSGRRFELVLGGCGALGAFQAGVYEALEEAGREPDLLVGTSIGALNAALSRGTRRSGGWSACARSGTWSPSRGSLLPPGRAMPGGSSRRFSHCRARPGVARRSITWDRRSRPSVASLISSGSATTGHSARGPLIWRSTCLQYRQPPTSADRKPADRPPENLEQDRQGNVKQNTTNQGYQQDR
jgi:Patatin-like phospholipase